MRYHDRIKGGFSEETVPGLLKHILILIAVAFFSFGAAAREPAAPSLEKIDLQLRWVAQFQFAGYYAAVEKGFYAEEGLEVHIHPGAPERQSVAEVLAGRAQYAVGNSEVLLARLQGKPLVALAVIFQHSPSVLLALRSSGISSAQDLIGKKVMFMDRKNDPDFMTMLLNEGVSPRDVTILPSSYDFNDLISGRVDAFNSYLTNEPYFLKERHLDYSVIDPSNYRVDFYSDILFTTEDEIQSHPKRAEAMRRATIKGWRYAMDHPDEMIDLLLLKFGAAKSRDHLKFEAEAMRPLILPDLIEIGHMNPDRWVHMANTFVRTGLIEKSYSLDGFIYDDPQQKSLPQWAMVSLGGLGVLLVISTLIASRFYTLNQQRTMAEARLKVSNDSLAARLEEINALQLMLQEQAVQDPVTGLYNRRYLDQVLDRELARAKREGYPVSLAMIDLDHFKQVNDTYGHMAGDEVLKSFGALLRTQAREGDIFCRFGGEEFVLVLPRMTLEVARLRADQWREAFGALKTPYGDFEIVATISIGLSNFPVNGATSEVLLDKADEALYRAKKGGRNCVMVAQ